MSILLRWQTSAADLCRALARFGQRPSASVAPSTFVPLGGAAHDTIQHFESIQQNNDRSNVLAGCHFGGFRVPRLDDHFAQRVLVKVEVTAPHYLFACVTWRREVRVDFVLDGTYE